MKKYKQSITDALLKLDYPIKFKRFKKLFKRIKKQERRFFIKLLRNICDEIGHNEKIRFALTSDLNLNQKGMLLVLDNRVVLIHSKKGAKLIHLHRIKYSRIEAIDFETDTVDAMTDKNSGILYIKVKRKEMGTKNFVIRSLNLEQLPLIVEFIRRQK